MPTKSINREEEVEGKQPGPGGDLGVVNRSAAGQPACSGRGIPSGFWARCTRVQVQHLEPRMWGRSWVRGWRQDGGGECPPRHCREPARAREDWGSEWAGRGEGLKEKRNGLELVSLSPPSPVYGRCLDGGRHRSLLVGLACCIISYSNNNNCSLPQKNNNKCSHFKSMSI